MKTVSLTAGLALVLAVAVCPALAAETPGSLAKVLQQQTSDELLPYLRQQGYKNVGVLKFLVQKGDGAPSDRVGTLNLTLAHRLQTALLLGQDLKKLEADGKEPLGIIQNASAVAATIDGASHLDAKGLSKLFTKKYPLLWGDQEVLPDAFVTGVAVLPRGSATIKVSLYVVDNKGTPPKVFDELTAELNSNLLMESGKDFLLRGGASKGLIKEGPLEAVLDQKEEALKSNQNVEKALAPSPLKDKDAPVVLEIFYDDKPINFQIDKATRSASIPEPQAGQQVRLVIRKVDATNLRYGVVLKVNGENTLFRQTDQNLQCTKWILENKGEQVEIKGYRVKDASDKYEEFRIAAPEESGDLEVKYGKDTGQISFVVFKDAGGKSLPPDDLPPGEAQLGSDATRTLRAINSGTSAQPAPADTPKPGSAQAAQLLAKQLAGRLTQPPPRGLVVPGPTRPGGSIQHVTFNPDPVPVLSATITYRPAAAK
jgi:hypothetical protein